MSLPVEMAVRAKHTGDLGSSSLGVGLRSAEEEQRSDNAARTDGSCRAVLSWFLVLTWVLMISNHAQAYRHIAALCGRFLLHVCYSNELAITNLCESHRSPHIPFFVKTDRTGGAWEIAQRPKRLSNLTSITLRIVKRANQDP
jgi:hypothetical protein